MALDTELLEELDLELQKTAVISAEFKQWILSKATELVSEAYRHGYDDGLREERKARRKK